MGGGQSTANLSDAKATAEIARLKNELAAAQAQVTDLTAQLGPAASASASVSDGSHRAALKPCDRSDESQKFTLGPCSSDGHIELGSPAAVTPGAHAPAHAHPGRTRAAALEAGASFVCG